MKIRRAAAKAHWEDVVEMSDEDFAVLVEEGLAYVTRMAKAAGAPSRQLSQEPRQSPGSGRATTGHPGRRSRGISRSLKA